MMEELICYCFHHTAPDVEEDARVHGRSTIVESILAAKQAGGCRCATENPKGR